MTSAKVKTTVAISQAIRKVLDMRPGVGGDRGIKTLPQDVLEGAAQITAAYAGDFANEIQRRKEEMANPTALEEAAAHYEAARLDWLKLVERENGLRSQLRELDHEIGLARGTLERAQNDLLAAASAAPE